MVGGSERCGKEGKGAPATQQRERIRKKTLCLALEAREGVVRLK